MNHDNLNKVYAWLHKGAPEFIFSMKYALVKIDNTNLADKDLDDTGYYRLAPSQQAKVDEGSCGSVCCIAGAAAQFDGAKPDEYNEWGPIQRRALEYFGINPKDYTDLPWMLPVFDPDLAPDNCGPRTAAAALKRWADHVAQNPTEITFNPWGDIE